MKQKRNTFSKEERLTGKTTIDELFDSGKSFFVYPLLVLYKKMPLVETPECRLLISVSKRKFKLAVDRNYIKRQIREFYRQNKHDLIEGIKDTSLDFALVYVGRKALASEQLGPKLEKALKQLKEKLND